MTAASVLTGAPLHWRGCPVPLEDFSYVMVGSDWLEEKGFLPAARRLRLLAEFMDFLAPGRSRLLHCSDGCWRLCLRDPPPRERPCSTLTLGFVHPDTTEVFWGGEPFTWRRVGMEQPRPAPTHYHPAVFLLQERGLWKIHTLGHINALVRGGSARFVCSSRAPAGPAWPRLDPFLADEVS